MKSLKSIVVLFLGFVALDVLAIDFATSESAAQDQTQLAWKFAKGDQFRLELDQLAKTNSEVTNRKVQISNRIVLKARWEVASVNETGTAKLIQVIDAVSMKMTNTNPEGGVATVEVDSEKETKDKVAIELLKDITPIIGQKVTFEMDAQGRVSNFEMSESTMEVLRDAPSSMEIRKIFSADGMKDVFGPAAVILPKEEIAAGHRWTGDREIENKAGKFKQTVLYSVPEIAQKESVVIKMISQTNIVGEPNEKIKVVAQSGSGSITFDTASGFMTKSLFKSTVQTETKYRNMTIDVNTVDEAMFTIEKVRGN